MPAKTTTRRKAASISSAPRKLARTRSTIERDHDHDYSGLLEGVTMRFALAAERARALFQTDASGLYDLYLSSIPTAYRQHHNCHACRRFIERFGGLVIVDGDEATSAMWNEGDAPEFYHDTFRLLRGRVERASITSVFHSSDDWWGEPVTGNWTHIAVQPPRRLVYPKHGRVLTPGQAMAASIENFRTVERALGEFSMAQLDEALRILEADVLSRSEKFVGPVKWLRELKSRPKGRRGDNALWLAVATAPEGYCHPRASVIGSLLEDIAAGLSFKEVQKRFDAKLHPLKYQRPQAAPSAGNIAAAEKIVEKLGIERSLERRFAVIEEVEAIWTPEREETGKSEGGVFAHLKPKAGKNGRIQPVNLPVKTMTWAKFSTTILPSAEQIALLVPNMGHFIALVTAEHLDAPPILKWDREEERNPVNWYVYPNGSPASQWNLDGGDWVKVNAITKFPNQWGSQPMSELADGVIMILDGARDTRQAGNALFPEVLKSELHAVRSTIEAYSRKATIGRRLEATACGYELRDSNGSSATCMLRVYAKGAWQQFHIDRWD